MNRPSHWILGSLAVFGVALWWSGAIGDYLDGSPSALRSRLEAARRDGQPVVVRAESAPSKAPSKAPLGRAATGVVSGRAVDSLGFPVAQATVRVLGTEVEVKTDERGRFRVSAPGVVHKRLRIEAPGVHDPVEVAGSLDPIDVVLPYALPWTAEAEELGTIAAASPAADRPRFGEGSIRNAAGEWVAGARVTVRETSVTAATDENGRYSIPLAAGPCTLVAFDGKGGVVVSETLRVPEREGKHPLPDLRLAPGPTLRGRLLTPDGEPLVDASILVEAGGVRRVTHSEQGGLFVVAGLVAGEVEFTVLPHRGHLGTRRALLVERDANLEDVVLQRPHQEPLRLTVTDLAGVAQPLVHVVATQIAGLCRAYGQADPAGRVVLAGLGDGQTTFEVRNRGFDRLPVEGFDAQHALLVVAR